MVSKLRPRNRSPSARRAKRRSAASISVMHSAGASASSQARKRTSARPSRIWAARLPATSTGFLQALGRAQGSGPCSGSEPAARSLRAIQAGAVRGSSWTLRPSAARLSRAGPSASGAATVTASASAAARSRVTLRGSMNSDARPAVSRTAKARATGVLPMSAPRMLNSQAIESGALRTTASTPRLSSVPATAARLAAESRPANSGGCGTAGEIGGAG